MASPSQITSTTAARITRITKDGGISTTDGVTNTGTFSLNGTGKAGSKIYLWSYENGIWKSVAPVKVTADGTWSYGLKNLKDGKYIYEVTTKSTAPKSFTGSYAVKIDKVGPKATIHQSFTDTGTSSSDRITKNGAVKLSGSVSDNTGGSGIWKIEIWDAATKTFLGNAKISANGTWSFSKTLPEGKHQLYAKVFDKAGNTTSTALQSKIVVDTTAPAVTIALKNDTGISSDDMITSVATLTGRGAVGSIVTIKEGSTVLGTATVGSTGVWTFTPKNLSQGTHKITATQKDAAGNVGSKSLTFTYDKTAPSAPAALALGSDSDSGVKGDNLTNVAAVTVTGRAAAGSTVTLYDGNKIVGTGTADANGEFSIVTDDLSDGAHDLKATATDAAGNVGPASGPLRITIDTAPPDMTSPDVGAIEENASGETTPVVVLTLSSTDNLSGKPVSYTLGGADASHFAIQDGKLVYTGPALDYEKLNAQHQFSVTVTPTDAAGNIGATQTITVNLTDVDDGPAIPVYSISDAVAVTEGSDLVFTVSRTVDSGPETVKTSMGDVVFAAGQLEATITVPTEDNATYGPNPDVTVTLISIESDLGTIDEDHASATGAVLDDETPPVYAISDATVFEGGKLLFTITSGTPVATDTVVTTDHGDVTILAGETSAILEVETQDNATYGPNPNVVVSLTGAFGNATGTGTVLDDETAPVYSISDTSVFEGGDLVFTITRTVDSGPETVKTSMGDVVFAAGQLEATITVPTEDNATYGTNPDVTVTLISIESGIGTIDEDHASATGTVLDDEDPPTFAISGAAEAEEGSILIFTVTRTGDAANAETVHWQAGSQSGVLTFNAGDTTQTFQVITTTDGKYGTVSAGSVTATISNPSEGTISTPSATTVLTDAEETDHPGSIGAITGTAAEGETLTAGTVTDPDGNPSSVTYQWQASTDGGETWSNVTGATKASYTLGYTDAGKQFRVIVAYTDGQGHQVTGLASASSAVVADAAVVTLTASADKISFMGDSAHTVNGKIGSGATLNSGDSVIGGAGLDTFVLTGFGSSLVTGFDFSKTGAANQLLGTSGATVTGFESVDASGYTGTTGLTLTGSSGANALIGGSGNDTIIGGGGADTLIGGAGNDTITYQTGSTIHADASPGAAGTDNDTLKLTRAVNINLSAENQDASGSSMVTGFENVDASGYTGTTGLALTGSSGANVLIGGSGNDTIIGGGGADTLTGGLGNDTFKFNSAAEIGTASGSRDVITDFQQGADKIDLSAIDASTAAGFQHLIWGGLSNKAQSGKVTYYQQGQKTYVEADINGDGVADFTIELNSKITLAANDFIL